MTRAAAALSCDDVRCIKRAISVLSRRGATRAARADARATLVRLVVAPALVAHSESMTPTEADGAGAVQELGDAVTADRRRIDDAIDGVGAVLASAVGAATPSRTTAPARR
jgi:hypothetical protein